MNNGSHILFRQITGPVYFTHILTDFIDMFNEIVALP